MSRTALAAILVFLMTMASMPCYAQGGGGGGGGGAAGAEVPAVEAAAQAQEGLQERERLPARPRVRPERRARQMQALRAPGAKA